MWEFVAIFFFSLLALAWRNCEESQTSCWDDSLSKELKKELSKYNSQVISPIVMFG
jgi:hypothetical protein